MANILVNIGNTQMASNLDFIDKELTQKSQLDEIEPNDTVWICTTHQYWQQLLVAICKRSTLVAILTHKVSYDEMQAALLMGCRGYCHIISSSQMLNAVAITIASGGIWVPKEFLSKVIRQIYTSAVFEETTPPNTVNLTVREKEVLQLVLQGNSNLKLAQMLDIKERTVKEHVGSILRKYEVKDRVALLLKIGEFSQVTE